MLRSLITHLTDRVVRKFQVQEHLTELQKSVHQLMEGDMGDMPVVAQDTC